MKFKINKGRISSILSILSRVPVSKKNSFMEKDSLFIEVVDGRLMLKVYDGYELYIESSIKIEDEFYEQGVARFDSKLFAHIIKGLDGEILVEDDDKKCTIYNRKTKIEMHSSTLNGQLNGLNIPRVDSSYAEFRIKEDVLKSSLEIAFIAVGKDINKPDLMNIMLECREDFITFISTDGYRLVKIDERCKSSKNISEKECVLLPSVSVPLLLGFLKGKKEICVKVNNEAVCFDLGDVTLHIRRGDHTKYPNIEKILERESGENVIIERSSIVRALGQINALGGDLVILESDTSKNKMIIRGAGDLIEKKSVGCEVVVDLNKDNSLNFRVPFRTALLYEGLKIMKSDELCMRIKSDRDFVVIRPRENLNILYLLIPCIL